MILSKDKLLGEIKELLVDYYNCPEGKERELLDGFANLILALIPDAEQIRKEEAEILLRCFVDESMRRYDKVNKEAPLYKKLLALKDKEE